MPAMGNSQFHAGQDLALSSSPTRIISPVRSMRNFKFHSLNFLISKINLEYNKPSITNIQCYEF